MFYLLTNMYMYNLIFTIYSFQTKAEDLMVKINDLDNKVTLTSAKLGTVTNKLMLLSHNQFIESRVYDEDVDENTASEKNDVKVELTKEESKNAIGNSLIAGAQFMQTAFEIVQVGLKLILSI